jgi:hypothetical protein
MLLRALIMLCCIGVLTSSAALFVQEYRATFFLQGTTNDQIAYLAKANYVPVPAASARTIRDLISNCAKLTLLAPALKADPALAQIIEGRCADIAAQIISTSPANARARALALLMAPKFSAADFAIAQKLAPYEPWPLATRLSAIAASANLDPASEALAKADFARALQSFWGRTEMVKLYSENPTLRPAIQHALTAIAPTEQANFIRLVRQTLAGAV